MDELEKLIRDCRKGIAYLKARYRVREFKMKYNPEIGSWYICEDNVLPMYLINDKYILDKYGCNVATRKLDVMPGIIEFTGTEMEMDANGKVKNTWQTINLVREAKFVARKNTTKLNTSEAKRLLDNWRKIKENDFRMTLSGSELQQFVLNLKNVVVEIEKILDSDMIVESGHDEILEAEAMYYSLINLQKYGFTFEGKQSIASFGKSYLLKQNVSPKDKDEVLEIYVSLMQFQNEKDLKNLEGKVGSQKEMFNALKKASKKGLWLGIGILLLTLTASTGEKEKENYVFETSLKDSEEWQYLEQALSNAKNSLLELQKELGISLYRKK